MPNGNETFSITSSRLASVSVRSNIDSVGNAPKGLVRQTSVHVLELSEKKARVLLSQKIYFKPSGPLQADLDFDVECDVPEGASKEDVAKLVREHAYPVYAEVTLVVGMITDKMLDTPLLLPPDDETEFEAESVVGVDGGD